MCHKPTSLAAFVERKDREFWVTWDEVAQRHVGHPRAELDAHLEWIGERSSQPDYRGCPHINVTADFPEAEQSSLFFMPASYGR
jgi:hypothetical protein